MQLIVDLLQSVTIVLLAVASLLQGRTIRAMLDLFSVGAPVGVASAAPVNETQTPLTAPTEPAWDRFPETRLVEEDESDYVRRFRKSPPWGEGTR